MEPIDGLEILLMAVGELKSERGFAAAGHGGNEDHGRGLLEAIAKLGDFGFASNKKRRGDGEMVESSREWLALAEEVGADFAKALQRVFAEVEIFYGPNERWDLAVPVEHGQ